MGVIKGQLKDVKDVKDVKNVKDVKDVKKSIKTLKKRALWPPPPPAVSDVREDCVEKLKTCQKEHLKVIYIIAIVVWIILVVYLIFLNKHVCDFPLWLKLTMFLPILVLIYNYYQITNESDVAMRRDSNNLDMTACLYLVIIIIIGSDIRFNDIHCFGLTVIIAAILTLVLLSTLDLWVGKDEVVYIQHLRSIAWVYSVSLMIFLILFLFVVRKKPC